MHTSVLPCLMAYSAVAVERSKLWRIVNHQAQHDLKSADLLSEASHTVIAPDIPLRPAGTVAQTTTALSGALCTGTQKIHHAVLGTGDKHSRLAHPSCETALERSLIGIAEFSRLADLLIHYASGVLVRREECLVRRRDHVMHTAFPQRATAATVP